MKHSRPVRVGFDLDGVILYNPVRPVRPIIAFVKEKILKKNKKGITFYVPKSSGTRFLWWLIHKSSLFVAPGFDDLKRLIKDNKIEVFIVTGRYGSLKRDFENWMKKVDGNSFFKGYFYNVQNEQPHIFKKRMIEKLDLDFFVEDNWDIVHFLDAEFKKNNRRILWITNILDQFIPYQYKFTGLNKVVDYLKRNT